MAIPIILISLSFIASGIYILVRQGVYRSRHTEKMISWNNAIAKRTGNAEVPEYSYTANGTEYIWRPDEQLHKIDETANEKEIFYNPENPGEATGYYLAPLRESLPWGIGCILAGVVSFFVLWAMTVDATVNEPFIGFLAGLLFASVGVGMTVFTVRLAIPISRSRKKTFTETTATCIKLLETVMDSSSVGSGYAGGRQLVFLPIFEYEAGGVTYQMSGYSPTNKTYSNIGIPDIGETRRIWVNPERPRDAYIEIGGSGFNFMALVAGVMSAAFLLAGIFTMAVLFEEIEQISLLLPPPPIASHALYVPFEAVGSFDSAQYPALMARYAAHADNIILMEIYEEALLAMLNDPSVSPLGRARGKDFLVEQYNPVELYVMRAYGYEIIFSSTTTPEAVEYFYIELGHGQGIFFFADYLEIATHEFLAGGLARLYDIHDPITEVQFIIFDDPHLRYAPAMFVWFSTTRDVYIVWWPLDDLTVPTLFEHDRFTQHWRDFVRLFEVFEG